MRFNKCQVLVGTLVGVTDGSLRVIVPHSSPSGSDQAEGLKRKGYGSRTTWFLVASFKKKANRNFRTAYYPSGTEENNKKPRFVFGAVAR